MSFDLLNLNPQIAKAIKTCGYDQPTPVQAQSVPAVLAGKDVLASARTGTGKTAAFMLPALDMLSNFKKGPKGAPRVLVLTPTRELAAQITEATRNYGKFLNVRSTVILGGSSYVPQFRDLSRPIDLVVGTPGRLIDHLQRGTLDLSRLELLILDEADRMLDMGFKPDMEKIIAAAPSERQTLMFSATLDETAEKMARNILNKPIRVEIDGRLMTHEKIEQKLFIADDVKHKVRLLKHLVEQQGVERTIIFSATKRGADRLAKDLKRDGHRAEALHGDMSQSARNRAVSNLRQGRTQLLVATDVAARGLDVHGISHVINFNLPQVSEDYIHRIGRTGRAGAAGTAISLVGDDLDVERLIQIQRYLGKEITQEVVDGMESTRRIKVQPKPLAKKRPHGAGAKRRNWKKKPGNRNRNSRPEVIERRSKAAKKS
ncbi:MAG: ATP-dependent helicase [Desulfuromonas sp.]|mgnify:CR=1 FL=1|nr:MAG: ATP-dependent helicase [Desulfuromonas sp.]